MSEFCTLPDDDQDLQHSALMRAPLLTVNCAREHGSILLTKTYASCKVP